MPTIFQVAWQPLKGNGNPSIASQTGFVHATRCCDRESDSFHPALLVLPDVAFCMEMPKKAAADRDGGALDCHPEFHETKWKAQQVVLAMEVGVKFPHRIRCANRQVKANLAVVETARDGDARRQREPRVDHGSIERYASGGCKTVSNGKLSHFLIF